MWFDIAKPVTYFEILKHLANCIVDDRVLMYNHSVLCMTREINFLLSSQISIVVCHNDDVRSDFIVVFLGHIWMLRYVNISSILFQIYLIKTLMTFRMLFLFLYVLDFFLYKKPFYTHLKRISSYSIQDNLASLLVWMLWNSNLVICISSLIPTLLGDVVYEVRNLSRCLVYHWLRCI